MVLEIFILGILTWEKVMEVVEKALGTFLNTLNMGKVGGFHHLTCIMEKVVKVSGPNLVGAKKVGTSREIMVKVRAREIQSPEKRVKERVRGMRKGVI